MDVFYVIVVYSIYNKKCYIVEMSVTRKKRLTICTYFEIRPQIEACV